MKRVFTTLPVLQMHMIIFIAIFCSPFILKAQQKNVPLNRFFSQEVERAYIGDSTEFIHMASKPYLESQLDISRVEGLRKDTTKVYFTGAGKLFKQHLFSIKKDDYFLAIDPLFDFSYGDDLSDTTAYATRKLFMNQRGLQFIGDIGKQFSFQTSFYETQTLVPLYLQRQVSASGVFPGFGRTKVYKVSGFDFGMSNGWVSYTPRSWINIQFGQGKNFIGNGYRSLLLSDAAFSYPYIKTLLTSTNKKWQYSAMYTSLQTLERLPKGEVPEALFKRKGGSFNYLSWVPTPGIEFGFFEGIIWERYDSTGTKPQPYGGYIPVIGVNTLLNGYGNVNHVITGLNARIRITKHSFAYGQFVTDAISSGRFGYQLGLKYFDLGVKNLDVQVEWNSLASNLYTSHYSLQSYAHMNQPLGHPSGPATQELVAIANYRKHRYIGQIKFNHIQHSAGPDGNWSNDPDAIQINIAPWPMQYVQQIDISAGLYVNTVTNLQLLVGYTGRTDHTDYNWMNDVTLRTDYLYVSLRTNLINRYSDF